MAGTQRERRRGWPAGLVAALLAAALGARASAPPPAAAPPATWAPDAVLVAFHPTAPGAARAAAAGRLGLRADAASNPHFARLRLSPAAPGGHPAAGIDVPAALAALRRDPTVRVAEPDYVLQALALPGDPLLDRQWGLRNTGADNGVPGADVDAPRAWDFAAGTADVVAVLDSGIDAAHEDLRPNLLRETDGTPVGYDFVNEDPDPADDWGHGTHVAGILAARGGNARGVSGVCQQARLLPLKILDAAGRGFTSNAIRALDFAGAHGARVANCSFGGDPFSVLFLEALRRAGDAGMLVVAAAGNDGASSDVRPVYPAGYSRVLPNVVAVAATNRRDELAGFSNFGLHSVDLAAPGHEIWSTLPGGEYGPASGTSMAAPFVAGAAALLWSRRPGLTPAEVRAQLRAAADHPAALDGLVGAGRLDAGALVETDTRAPFPPAGLALTHRGADTLRLAWSAPGDDAGLGTAAAYELRYARAPLTPAGFAAAEPVEAPFPAAAGTPQSCLIEGLEPDTAYYVGLRAVDNVGNRSSLATAGPFRTLPETRLLTLADDAEGVPQFSGPFPWSVSDEDHVSGSRSYTDSPRGLSAAHTGVRRDGRRSSALTQNGSCLVPAGLPLLTFRARLALEESDALHVEVSADNGVTWTAVLRLSGSQPWTTHRDALPAFRGRAVKLRFRLVTTDFSTADGVWLDDIRLGAAPADALLSWDDAEGEPQYSGDAPWAAAGEARFSGRRAYTDSPATLYGDGLDLPLTAHASVTAAAGVPVLSFWAELALEAGLDFLVVETRAEGESEWQRAALLTGHEPGRFYTLTLPDAFGRTLQARFRLVTSASGPGDGVWLDDLAVGALALLPVLPPPAPAGLAALPAGEDRVELRWKDAAADETGFEIERQLGDEPFRPAATAPPNATRFLDTGLQPGTRVIYRVRSVNAAGASPYAGPVSVTTPPAPVGALRAPRRVEFGTVARGRAAERRLTLRNDSKQDALRVALAELAPPFTLVATTEPVLVPPGGTRTVLLRFTPDRRGRAGAVLTITSSDPRAPQVRVRLSGRGK